MKKVVSKKVVVAIIVLVMAALTFTAVAYAVTQGSISGGGNFTTSIGVGRITFNTGGAFDGQVGAFYNLRNDRSGNCDGDHGQINVKYTAGTIAAYQIVCAHYSNCRSFSVDYIDTFLDPTGNTYVIVRAINVKPPAKDRIQIGVTTDPALAQDWVNLGYVTGGAFADGHVFPEVPLDNGNWTIQPKPLDCTPPA